MTGEELRRARRALGEMWGLARPLTLVEMARALRLSTADNGKRMKEYELRDEVSGPISVAVDLMLAGAAPPDGLAAITGASHFEGAGPKPSRGRRARLEKSTQST